MNQGHSAAWDQDWEQAAKYYRQALVEFPADPKALNNLGLALFELGELEQALRSYLKACEASPQDPIPFDKVAQISEKLGRPDMVTRASLKSAELYLNRGETDKAVESLIRLSRSDPENLAAHSRLGLIYERRDDRPQAVTEYLIVASLLQHKGDSQNASQAILHALQIIPESPEAQQAMILLKEGKLLPKPAHSKGFRDIPESPAPGLKATSSVLNPSFKGLDPVAEARQVALSMLAGLIFDQPELARDSQQQVVNRGLLAIMRGSPRTTFVKQTDPEEVVIHLTRAVDLLSKKMDDKAVEELERATEAGLEHAAAFFEVGYIRLQGDRLESAIRFLQRAVNHADFALAGHLLLGQTLEKLGRLNEATIEYLEALKFADSLVVPQHQMDEIQQLYEPLIEAESLRTESQAKERLCQNIKELILRADWRERIARTRQELMGDLQDGPPMPIGEMLSEVRSSQIVEAIMTIHQLARVGQHRSAMEEAFFALQYAPTYLPLHTYMGELLLQEDRIPEAIDKFTIVAQTYSVRGEASRAIQVFNRIIRAAPMDLRARSSLIDLLVARGEMNTAVQEYLGLAEVYYNLADLTRARKTYNEALRLAQQSKQSWNLLVDILHHIADIDLQSLDWRQALRIYEQIRTMRPDDSVARANLIGLNIRLSQEDLAEAELQDYLVYLEKAGESSKGIPFMESLLNEYPHDLSIRSALADAYRKAGRREDAIREFDFIGERFVEMGDRQKAAEIVAAILALDPPNKEAYQQLLSELRGAI
jgi:tetratricopeptide (TPR) repeat protein